MIHIWFYDTLSIVLVVIITLLLFALGMMTGFHLMSWWLTKGKKTGDGSFLREIHERK